MVRILIHGISGKMGQMLVACANDAADMEVVAGVDIVAPASADIPYFSTLADCTVQADVVIDFTRASSLPALLDYARATGTRLVIATTGHTPEDKQAVREASQSVAIFQAANMALGVNAMAELAMRACASLPGFDVEIIEKHHNTKIDAPSGTALMLADAVNEEKLGQARYVYERHSRLQRRDPAEIGIHSVRGGSIFGEHEVLLAGPDEVLSISHTAYSRRVFAMGALQAARYVAAKGPGVYTMKDLLLEKSGVTNLYVDREQAMVTVSKLPFAASAIARVLGAMAESAVNVDMIGQTAPQGSTVDLSFTLPMHSLAVATERLQTMNAGGHLDVATDVCKLTVEGLGMERQSGVAARVFGLLGGVDVAVRLITTSETKISMCIDRRDEDRAVQALRAAFQI